MKQIVKQALIWSGTLVLSTGVAFASFFDYSALNKDNGNSNSGNETPVVQPSITPQQALLNSIITLKEAEVSGNIEAKIGNDDLNIGLNGKLALDTSNIANTRFEGHTDVQFNGLNFNGDLQYYDEKIFLDYEQSKMFLKTDSILDFVNMIPNYGINLTLPEELTSLDINKIMADINAMEPEKVNDGYFFKLNLNDNIELMLKSDDEYNFTGVMTNKFFFEDTFIYLDFDVNQKLSEPLTFTDPDILEYEDFAPTFDMINVLYNTFSSTTNTLNLNVGINYLDNPYLTFNGDLSYDTQLANISLKGNVIEESHDRTHSFILGMKDQNLLVNYNNLKLRIQNQSIGTIFSYVLNKVADAYLDDAFASLSGMLQNNDVGGLLDDLSTFNNLIKKIDVTENAFVVHLNLDVLGLEANDVSIEVDFDKTSFQGVQIHGLNIDGYTVDIDVTQKDYSPINFNLEDYVAVDPALCLVDAFEALSKESRFRLDFNATVDNQTGSNQDLHLDGGLQFDLANKFGYGELNLLDPNSYNHNIKVDMRNYDEILFTYNDKTKGRFSSNFFTDVIDMVSEILNNKDDHFYELFGDMMESMSTLPIMDAINNKDYGKLFEIGLIDSLNVTPTSIQLGISGGLIGIDSTLNLELDFDSDVVNGVDVLKALKVTDFKYGDNVYSFEIQLNKFNDELESTRLDPFDNYIEFDSLAVLLRLGINTSVYNNYHFTGKATVKISPIIDKEIPIDVKILNEKGNVSIAIDFPEIPIISGVNNGEILSLEQYRNRHVQIFYKDNYFYIHRIEQVKQGIFLGSWKTHEINAKVESGYFLDNIVTYLCQTVLGLNSTIMSQIVGDGNEEDTPSDSTIHYENILSDYSYNTTTDTPYFLVGINIAELAQSDMFSDLTLKVFVDDESKTLSGIEANININVLLTISLGANLTLDNLGQEFSMEEMNNYLQAHQNDEVNKTYESTY